MAGAVRQEKLEGAGRGAGDVEGDAVDVRCVAVKNDLFDVARPLVVYTDELEGLVAQLFEIVVAVQRVVRKVNAAVQGGVELKIKPAGVRRNAVKKEVFPDYGSCNGFIETERAVVRRDGFVSPFGIVYFGVRPGFGQRNGAIAAGGKAED